VDIVGDLFHYGHVEFLRRARELGDVLVVGVHSDETVSSYKRTPIMSMDERIGVIEACRYVDEVIPDAPVPVDEAFIRDHRIDLVVHGDDMDTETLAQHYHIAQSLGIFRTVPYTAGISTSAIIRRLARQSRSSPR
jgi:ethanolamine-phosphate cytidylyltransferase/choline-phosphate cytidylyltransferase